MGDAPSAPTPPGALTRLRVDRSAEMPGPLVGRAILVHLASMLRAKGVAVPSDVELFARAKLFVFDENGARVQIGRAQITWEDE